MYVMSCDDGYDRSGVCGRFDEDLDLAVRSAANGFNCLLGHKACIEPETNKLPRRLRKESESANDHICHVTTCAMRR
jgi:hypothetical protein